MIVDTHLHLGTMGKFNLKYETLLQQMDLHGIDVGIVSSVECAEYRPDAEDLFDKQIPQLEANRRLLEQCKKSNGRLYLSFWAKPAKEKPDGVYEFLKENCSLVKGMNFHPFYSRLPLEDSRYIPYLEIARELELPVSVHLP